MSVVVLERKQHVGLRAEVGRELAAGQEGQGMAWAEASGPQA